MIIQAEKISKTYADGRKGLLEQSFRLKQGENLCISGESGSGKTTVLNIITGMLCPSTGDVFIDGKNIYKQLNAKQRAYVRSHQIGYMCYGNTLLENLTVWQNLTLPLQVLGKQIQSEKWNMQLAQLEITDLKRAYPKQLSAGEYRRVCLARTLLMNPELVVADEPTSNLDEQNAKRVRDMLEKVKNSETSLIIVTHDKKMQFEPMLEL